MQSNVCRGKGLGLRGYGYCKGLLAESHGSNSPMTMTGFLLFSVFACFLKATSHFSILGLSRLKLCPVGSGCDRSTLILVCSPVCDFKPSLRVAGEREVG